MKLVTRTLKTEWNDPVHFFVSQFYRAYLQNIDYYFIDRSSSYHDKNTILYIVELIPDHLVDFFERSWGIVIENEQKWWDARLITCTVGIQDAFDKK